MSNDKMREGYEKYYALPWGVEQEAWEASWKASREALVIELPEEDPTGWGPSDCGDGLPSEEQYIASHCNMVLKKCRKSIEAAGVNVRSNSRESPNLADDAMAQGFAHCVFSEEILDVAYWDFDARIKGYPPYGVPSGNQAHAFKTAVFAAVEAAIVNIKK